MYAVNIVSLLKLFTFDAGYIANADAFCAGFLHQFLSFQRKYKDNGDGEDWMMANNLSQNERQTVADQMVRFASVAGALTCTKEGAIAAQPTLEEIACRLKLPITN